jgi:7,8-dihydroneopterin aldolase/epimerase/oxygenase
VTDAIVVRGIASEGFHGLPGERDHPQWFVADVELRFDVAGAARADRIDATVDYTAIASVARRVISEKSFELLETIADTIASEVLALGGQSVRVKVVKPRSAKLVGTDEIAVVVERP